MIIFFHNSNFLTTEEGSFLQTFLISRCSLMAHIIKYNNLSLPECKFLSFRHVYITSLGKFKSL